MFIYGEYNLFYTAYLETIKECNLKRFCKDENIDFYYLKNLISNKKHSKTK
ncbi:hypothetical protein SAMN02745163_00089 [Clostridium cavendishii DSM 21758]|uniref:Uncharacterized protein n=1 Tax=Clostridium cavendishii DSM 21758 TaxID=1121302 RepID=A0A1M6AHZ0_9CLOT|nr:hypothetical protein [Clostridium cavendishii]SHI36109.1 hypothetical protein SAMN02745163_00089 [Clostridium cavendishii DSM 21758]